MLALLAAIGIAVGVLGYEQAKKAAAAGQGGTPAPQPSTPGPTDSTGTGPTNIVNPPIPKAPPAPTGPLAPGVYPAGTAGALPIVIAANGGDAPCYVTVAPGGQVANTDNPKTYWYGPGTWVVVTATVDRSVLGGIGTAFDHFEGPGVSTHENPIRVQVNSAGFVRGLFAWFGVVGR